MLNETGRFAGTTAPGKGSDGLFFNFTAPQYERAALETNDTFVVTLIPKD